LDSSDNVQIRVSYGGLESDTFWIFNNAPMNLHDIATNQMTRSDGWETQKKLKVRDLCNGGMRWVEVNETFSGAGFDYPGTVSGWPLFNWTWGVWDNSGDFSSTGDFIDYMYELRQTGKVPAPMNTGANSYSETSADQVMHATQQFFAGSPIGGQGIQVQQNTQVHYLDHGAHK
jgi:hypothetical protein